MRTCVGCQGRFPQRALVRWAVVDGRVVMSRTAPGRGAWLCAASPSCLATAVRRRAFARALRAPLRDAGVKTTVAAFSQNLADLSVAGRSPDTPRSSTKG